MLPTGIPYPVFSHKVLGHPDRMLHPLKHELRLETCDDIRGPIHQVSAEHLLIALTPCSCC